MSEYNEYASMQINHPKFFKFRNRIRDALGHICFDIGNFFKGLGETLFDTVEKSECNEYKKRRGLKHE